MLKSHNLCQNDQYMQDFEKAVMVTRVCSKNWWNTDKKPLLVCPQKDVDKERQRNRKGYSKAFCATSKRKKSWWLLFVLPEIENTYWQHAVFDLEHFHKNIWLALLEIIYSALQNSDEKKQNTFLIKTRFHLMVNNTKKNTFSNYTWSLFLKKENSFIQIREFIYKQKKTKNKQTKKQKSGNKPTSFSSIWLFQYIRDFRNVQWVSKKKKRKYNK